MTKANSQFNRLAQPPLNDSWKLDCSSETPPSHQGQVHKGEIDGINLADLVLFNFSMALRSRDSRLSTSMLPFTISSFNFWNILLY
jgi:hypothetical protein